MTDLRERRLLVLAAVFLFLYCLILTLSPAVREKSWDVSYHFSQWIGLLVWMAVFLLGHRFLARRLPDRDPYLLPLASLLSGWGILTIWRLDPSFGLRQAVWLAISIAALLAIVTTADDLSCLRRYKYILLAAGLFLTALTLILGTNPTGAGPRLWLGCCGLYLQPSEPLKLLLLVYWAAYLADRIPIRMRIFPLLLPTAFVTGIALLLLIVQRDLGTASIFIVLYTAVLYIATGKSRVLLATCAALTLAGLTGFFVVDVVHARLESWANPWNDPSGTSYQVVQSLLAIANGGVFGRGPGIGSPSLVPVAHSDFIFAAISEEAGLLGSIGLLGTYALLLTRGLIIALRAPDTFRRLLAAGLTAYVGIQAIVIIGGNVRLLPLTGVTLPFVSYGGSSLLTSLIATGLLLAISTHARGQPAPLASFRPYYVLAAALGAGLLGIAFSQSWWGIIRGTDLLSRTDNPRLSIADRYVPRGSIFDRNNQAIDVTIGTSGSFKRSYDYPPLAPVVGYIHPTYGQAGLEASLDDYLRGLQGNPTSLVFWDRLVYGTTPPGLDVRLSISLTLQAQADRALGSFKGAVVLLNASTGEILAMASHPIYNPNQLDALGSLLARDPTAPLLNRAAQGAYPTGTVFAPLMSQLESGGPPGNTAMVALYQKLGFFSAPQIRMPVAAPSLQDSNAQTLRLSPLQLAVAAASVSNKGTRPAPRIALAVDTPQQGWVVLPALGDAVPVFFPDVAERLADQFAARYQPYWQWTGAAPASATPASWYVAGTMPNWKGTPLALVVLLEANSPSEAQRIGQQILQFAIRP